MEVKGECYYCKKLFDAGFQSQDAVMIKCLHCRKEQDRWLSVRRVNESAIVPQNYCPLCYGQLKQEVQHETRADFLGETYFYLYVCRKCGLEWKSNSIIPFTITVNNYFENLRRELKNLPTEKQIKRQAPSFAPGSRCVCIEITFLLIILRFKLRVEGAEEWSWADIVNNGAVVVSTGNLWNERQDKR